MYLYFYKRAEAGLAQEPPSCDRALLLHGLTAVLCLSVMGTLCSGKAYPTAAATRSIYTATIPVFVLYDVLLAVLVAREQRARSAWAARLARRACCGRWCRRAGRTGRWPRRETFLGSPI